MKKRLVVLSLVLFLVFLSSTALAGEIKVIVEEEKMNGDIQIQPDSFKQQTGGIKGNGGPSVGMMQVDLKELNQILVELGFEEMEEDIIIFGGGGLGGIKSGIRFGGVGMTGKQTTRNDDGDTISLEISYGGFLFEQGILAGAKTDLAIGGLFGGGIMHVNLVEDFRGDFEEALRESHSTSLQKEFMMIEPRISLHQQLMAFIGLNISIGYIVGYDMGSDWDFFGSRIDGPLELIQGPTASIRLSFGF